jgi:hypothetical protein
LGKRGDAVITDTAGYPFSHCHQRLREGALFLILFVKNKHERKKTMKKLFKTLLILLASILVMLSLGACDLGKKEEEPTTPEGQLAAIWNTATYTENAEVGSGSKTITVDVVAKGHTVTLTVKTDAANLGDALYALELINDASFFDVANGMKADWNADQAYWAFYIGETMASYGVNDAAISGGEYFRLVYTQ